MSRSLVRVAAMLLGLLTVATFGGYFLIGQALKGGASPSWPPDRPVEWLTFAGVTATVVASLLGIGVIWLMSLAGVRKDSPGPAGETRTDSDAGRGGP